MRTFLRYIVTGSSALGLHLLILQSLLFAGACAAWTASAIGFIAACALNYTVQRLWVFRSGRSHASALPHYIAITSFMLGVNTLLFAALFATGLPPLAAQTATTGGVFMLNFFANRRFTFGSTQTAIQ